MNFSIPRLTTIVDYVVVLHLIFFSNSIWSQSLSVVGIKKILFISFLISILISFLLKRKLKVAYMMESILVLVCLDIFLLIYIYFNRHESGAAFTQLMVLNILVFYYYVYLERNFLRILKIHRNIIVVLSVVSLFFWFFGSQLGLLRPNMVWISVWADKNGLAVPGYYHLYFEPQGFLGIMRNSSVFVEAAMFAFQLVLALATELLLQKNISKWRAGVLVITTLTTLSATAIVLGLLTVMFRFLITQKSKLIAQLKVILSPLILVLVSYAIFKILTIHANSGSSSAIRWDDFAIGFKVWRAHPIFGTGFNNVEVLKQQMGLWRSFNTGFSNSPMLILAQGGLYLFSLYLIPFVRGLYLSYKSGKNGQFFYILIFLLLFTVTIMPYNYLVMLLLLSLVDGYPTEEMSEEFA